MKTRGMREREKESSVREEVGEEEEKRTQKGKNEYVSQWMTDTESGLGGPERDYGEAALVRIIMAAVYYSGGRYYRDKLTRRVRRGEGFGFSRALHLYTCVSTCVETGISCCLFWYTR